MRETEKERARLARQGEEEKAEYKLAAVIYDEAEFYIDSAALGHA